MRKLTLNFTIFCLGLSLSLSSFAESQEKKVAKVRVIRGSAEVAYNGVSSALKKGEWLKEGSQINTGAKSFVKLSFIDKSSMNIGPNSEVVIEKFGSKKAGVINVLSGKIRSQVTKNYLEIEEGKSKLFVKSKSAVMGIRGTDFMFAASKKTGATTAILFEGSVVFNKFNASDKGRDLESIVNRGRRINPGQFSIATREQTRATVPSKINSKQFFRLEKNKNLDSSSSEKQNAKTTTKSIVPKGLSGSVVKSESTAIANEITKITKTLKPKESIDIKTTKGFRSGEDLKPADGSLVHIESGTVIPMGRDSLFDANTNEWTSSTNGSVSSDGEYIPPVKHEITDQGDLIRIDTKTGEKVIVSTEISSIDAMPEFTDLPGTVIEEKNNGEGPAPAGVQEKLNNDGQLPPPPTAQDCDTCNRPGSIFNPSRRFTTDKKLNGKTKVRATFQ